MKLINLQLFVNALTAHGKKEHQREYGPNCERNLSSDKREKLKEC